MPVVGLVRIPFFAKLVCVLEVAATNIAVVVKIFGDMVIEISLLTTSAGLPVLIFSAFPITVKAVKVLNIAGANVALFVKVFVNMCSGIGLLATTA